MPQSAQDIAMYGDRTAANQANADFQAASDLFAKQNSSGQATPDQKAAYDAATTKFKSTPLASGTANPQDAGFTQGSKPVTATPDNRGLGNFTGTTNPNGSGVALDANGNAVTNNGQPVQSSEVSTPNQPAGLQMPSTNGQGLQMPTGAAAGTVFDPISGKQVSPAEAALNAKKASGEKPPQDSSNGVSAATSDITSATPPPPQTGSTPTVDNFLNKDTNPTVAQQVDTIMATLSPQATTDTLNSELSQIQTDKATLAGLRTDLMNINNVMSGSETDIRNEIQAAGGMATNSQVMALSAARNKTLLQQAKLLQEQITTQTNTVNSDVSLYNSDKALATQQYNERSGILKMLETNQKAVDTATKSTYSAVVKAMGYSGLYASLQSDPTAVANAERVMGFQPGQLETLAKGTDTTNNGTTVTYDAQGNQITTKNGQVTKIVEPKPKSGKTVKQTQTQIANESTNNADTYLKAKSGQDGYVSPEDYQTAKNAWIQDGQSATSFDSKFGKYTNPADPQDYRQQIQVIH